MKRRVLMVLDWIVGRPLRVGLALAGLVLLTTFFIQIVLLGLVMPQWSDGHGLVPGQDVVRFNRVAMEQAALIRELGWQAWELRPNGWGVSGILSAWYALTWPAPWAFAPVQALMYGACGAIIFALVSHLTGRPRWALLAVLPMLLPTAAFIYAQPHRDVFAFFGLTLAIYGWWRLARLAAEPVGRPWITYLLTGTSLVFAGFVVAWAVRAYTAQIFQGIALLMSVLLGILAMASLWRSQLRALPSLTAPAIAISLMVAMGTFPSDEPPDSQKMSGQSTDIDRWQAANWLPERADDLLRDLASARDHFADGYDHGRTAMDVDYRYHSVEDILLYTPRALQIGLLSPFPRHWLPDDDASSVRNMYRVIAGAEMVVLYAVLPFLLYAVWVWGRRPELWVMLMPSLLWIMVYAYTVPVVGSLMRYRYGAYLIILALAVSGFARALHDYRSRSEVKF